MCQTHPLELKVSVSWTKLTPSLDWSYWGPRTRNRQGHCSCDCKTNESLQALYAKIGWIGFEWLLDPFQKVWQGFLHLELSIWLISIATLIDQEDQKPQFHRMACSYWLQKSTCQHMWELGLKWEWTSRRQYLDVLSQYPEVPSFWKQYVNGPHTPPNLNIFWLDFLFV